jgi:dienelactone hydrolase
MTSNNRLVVVALACALGSAQAVEKVSFDTYTPQDYAAMLNGEYLKAPIRIQGFLERPANASGKMPAVVIVPGSGGYAKWMQDTIATPLNQGGYITLIVDSFTARGVKETGTNQGSVPMSASVMDGFQALRYLSGREDVDTSRIAVTGFSRGGVASMFTQEERLYRSLGFDALRFAAHVPFYPGCSTQWQVPTPSSAPILFLLGEKDEMTPPEVCIGYASRLKQAGVAVKTIVYPGALHAWTADYQPRHVKAHVFAKCDLQIDEGGTIFDMKTGSSTKQGWSAFVKNVMKSCGEVGATIGGNDAVREQSVRDLIKFLDDTLVKK